jgi:DNA (cytosine-5)-methyltransferase 1
VKDVLELNNEGISIFERKKPLSEKTLERIYCGLVKYVAGGKDYFISKYYSGKPQSKNITIDGPAATVTCVDGQALVKACFIHQRNSGNPSSKVASVEAPARTITTTGGNQDLVQVCFMTKYNSNTYKKVSNPVDINDPSPTITTQGRLAVVQAQFMQSYYGNGGTHSIEDPAPTVTTKDRLAMISTEHFIDRQFSQGTRNQSVDVPHGALTTVPKSNLVTVDKWLMDTQYNNVGRSIEDPAPVITANRKHHYLVTTETGEMAIAIYATDSPMTVKIKQFMAAYGIVDIKMRMLLIHELLLIMGFPGSYILKGTQADKKKFIGNAVVTVMAQKLAESLAYKLLDDVKCVNF